MEKWKATTLMAVLITFLSSCHFGRGERVIVETNNSHYLRIEYSGRITFSDDSTSIARISRNGHLKFEADGRKLEAERVGDKIIYRLYDQIETSTLTDHDKRFVAEAVREMMKKGHYRN